MQIVCLRGSFERIVRDARPIRLEALLIADLLLVGLVDRQAYLIHSAGLGWDHFGSRCWRLIIVVGLHELVYARISLLLLKVSLLSSPSVESCSQATALLLHGRLVLVVLADQG